MCRNSGLLALIMIAILIVSGLAQTSPRSDSGARSHIIRGKLFLPSGRLPEQRMRVVLEVMSGGIFSDTFTDSVGNFEFRSLPSNTYKIVVPGDGFRYETVQESIEVSGSISRTFSAQIYLREKNNPNTSKDRMISAAEFSQDVPKAAKKSYEQGLKKMKGGKNDEAATLFQDAIKSYPEYVLALNKLGECYVSSDKLPEAQSEFEKAIAISSKYPVSYINLGILKVRQKQYDAAIESLDTAVRLNESFPMAHLSLGIAWLEKTPPDAGNLEKAENSFNKAIALGGKDLAQAHKYIFNIHYRRKQFDKAADDLTAYLEAMPNAPDAPAIKQVLEKLKARTKK